MAIVNCFDFETTGLIINRLRPIEKQPWAVELYMELLDTNTLEVGKKFESYFKPGAKMDKEAEKVTGLKDDFLLDKPLFSDKIDEIQAMIDESEYMAGQNVMFDIGILIFEFRRCGRELDLSGKRLIDTIEQTSYLMGYRPKLGDLYEYFFNRRFADSHKASADAVATTEILVELIKRGDLRID
jgi:DNA polymerase III epsilon subunit-like protein